MTTLTGIAGIGKTGTLSPFTGIVQALTGLSGLSRTGTLTLPSFLVPLVEGLLLAVADTILRASSFKVGSLTYESNASQVGTVLKQSPNAGTSQVENTPINLLLSTGPASPTTNPVTNIRLPNLPNKILPPDNQLVDNRGVMKSNWWRFLLNVSNQAMGTNETVPSTVAVTASPFEFITPTQGTVLVSGGPVTMIEYSKDGVTWYPTGVTQGQIQLVPNDHLRITYLNPPTVTFFPR